MKIIVNSPIQRNLKFLASILALTLNFILTPSIYAKNIDNYYVPKISLIARSNVFFNLLIPKTHQYGEAIVLMARDNQIPEDLSNMAVYFKPERNHQKLSPIEESIESDEPTEILKFKRDATIKGSLMLKLGSDEKINGEKKISYYKTSWSERCGRLELINQANGELVDWVMTPKCYKSEFGQFAVGVRNQNNGSLDLINIRNIDTMIRKPQIKQNAARNAKTEKLQNGEDSSQETKSESIKSKSDAPFPADQMNGISIDKEEHSQKTKDGGARQKIPVPKTGKEAPRKPCQTGYERNPMTGRCRKIKTLAAVSKECKAGYERNPQTGRCRKVPTKKENLGAAEPLKEVSSENYKMFGALMAVLAVAGAGAVYVVLQFRGEIWNFIKKIRQKIKLFTGPK